MPSCPAVPLSVRPRESKVSLRFHSQTVLPANERSQLYNIFQAYFRVVHKQTKRISILLSLSLIRTVLLL